MTTKTQFAKISENNRIVDQTIDQLVQRASTRIGEDSVAQQLELDKTSQLLLLSSLIQGDAESADEFEFE